MRKIGIMTYHYSYNFGAMMQAYALRKAIICMVEPEDRVDIINHIPPTFVNQGESITNRAFLRKKTDRDRFLREQCGILTEPTSDISELEEYDIYIVGSDQVWNPNLPVFEKTSEYFLDFVPNGKRRVAYAASIGEAITQDFSTELFEKNIKKFDFLSVREQSYCSFIERFTEKKCEAVLDPTFLLEPSHYIKMMPQKEEREPYVLVITYAMKARRKLYDIANRYSIRHHQEIIHTDQVITPYFFMNPEETLFYSSMEEVLWYINHAEIVLTDSFHFMLFSIIMHRPFYVMLTGRPTRITDLLSYLGLTDRILDERMRLSDLESPIDYERVDQRINEKKDVSLSYLKRAVGDFY